jgi:methionyl-tRNA formyltransferase
MTKLANQPKVKIVFFGSGPVAARSLELLANDFIIEGVITKPRAPHHKGAVPVIETATQLKIPIHTVNNKEELDKLVGHSPYKSEVAILIDFGIIVTQYVIDSFPKGIINSHFSILPEWRGADPITFSVLSGQKDTGVSLMLVVKKMDEGPLLAYDKLLLDSEITTPLLTEMLIAMSYRLLKDTVPNYLHNNGSLIAQSTTGRDVTYSRKLSKTDGVIDWNKSATVIEREIRAYIDWPRSRTTIFDRDVVITKSHILSNSMNYGKETGEVITINHHLLGMQTRDSILVIDKLIPAGKREMSGREFIRGYIPK